MINTSIGRYKIIRLIGEGGMSIVYLADHNTLNQPVAIKVLNKEFVQNDNIRKRFLAEARNMARMSHPNIIKVTDLVEEGDTVAFAMEYMEGQTLKEYLETKGKLNDDEIKKLFVQMLDAVGYVHEQGLIHRDIKPSNFMISSKGIVKLLDFGIAKNTDQSSAEYTQTGSAQSMGTPMYMSPEQIKSTKEVTAQSDIYSLGVVLWQIVTGKKPYDINTTSTFELQTKIVNEKLAPTNTLFDDVITGATAKDLINRYSSSLQMKNQLLQARAKNLESTKLHNSKVSEQTLVQGKGVTENGKTKNFENILDSNLRTQQITGGNSSSYHLSDKKNKGRKWVIIVFFFLTYITYISLRKYYDYIQRKTLIEYREYRDKIKDAGGIALPRAEWEKLKPRP